MNNNNLNDLLDEVLALMLMIFYRIVKITPAALLVIVGFLIGQQLQK